MTEDAKTLARVGRSRGPHDTLVEPSRRPGFAPAVPEAVTLQDYAGAAPTTRTEILPVSEAPWPGDVVTNTRVPTPTNSARTLDPVPLPDLAATQPTARRRSRAVFVGAATLFVVALGLGSALTRVFTPPSAPPPAPVLAVAPLAAPAAATSPALVAVDTVVASDPRALVEPAERPAAPKKSAKKSKSEAVSLRVPDGLPSSGL